MNILEWLLIAGISATIIIFVFFCYFFIRLIINLMKAKKLPKRLPKNKKKRRRIILAKRDIAQKKRSSVKFLIVTFLFLIMFGGGTAYGSYYQSTNLSSEDADRVVSSYYLVRDFQTQVVKAANQAEEEDALQRDLRYLSSKMASYSSFTASNINTVDGQTALNRYYAALGQLGMNASREVNDFYGNTELMATYQRDIERVMSLEEQAFGYYEVDEEALASEVEMSEPE
ncbi:hypothetical protein [Enterococcus sp. HY326]|uniref:hypothetical protein n=1 Tax=Enterococcus sp. HY326 TaxID=2971265 RepID=UPI002240178A|nr:hypothetical protein [Enterococcus sp. HY326]